MLVDLILISESGTFKKINYFNDVELNILLKSVVHRMF